MGERLTSLFSIVLLAGLAALTYWLDRVVQVASPVREKAVLHDPDYVAEKLLVTRMGLDGRVRDTLQAVKLTHFPDDDNTELSAPRFTSYGYGAPLTISARQGRVTSQGGNVYFVGDVVLRRNAAPANAAGGAGAAMTLNTDYLHLLPDDNIARTDKPVTIEGDALTMTAGGMELNAETRVLKLSGGVRGAYNAANPPVAGGRAR